MLRIAKLSKKGFSLVEVLIALVILLLVSLALMQTALVSISANMTNVLRDEAVAIAEREIIAARNIPFDTLATAAARVENANFRNFQLAGGYTVTRTVTNRGVNNKQIDVRVDWSWKGEPFFHIMNSIRRNS